MRRKKYYVVQVSIPLHLKVQKWIEESKVNFIERELSILLLINIVTINMNPHYYFYIFFHSPFTSFVIILSIVWSLPKCASTLCKTYCCMFTKRLIFLFFCVCLLQISNTTLYSYHYIYQPLKFFIWVKYYCFNFMIYTYIFLNS